MNEATIFYQTSKSASEPAHSAFHINGEGLVGLNGSDFMATGTELTAKVLKLAEDNADFHVRNAIPYVDNPDATLLETSPASDYKNSYRPLNPEEIPQEIQHLLI